MFHLGTAHLIFGGGGGVMDFFLKIFFLFSSDRNQRCFFSHSLWAKILFSGQSKNEIFFSKRSCISGTQYTWVYCLYVRLYMYLGYLGQSVYVHIKYFFQFQLSSDNLSCWCSSFYIEWYSHFWGYKLQGKNVNEKYSLGARNIYFL